MSDLSYLQAMMKPLFKDVYVVKPESSRQSSSEAFIIGLGYMATLNVEILKETLQTAKTETIVEETKEEEEDKLTF